jgi:hypothetical protein
MRSLKILERRLFWEIQLVVYHELGDITFSAELFLFFA